MFRNKTKGFSLVEVVVVIAILVVFAAILVPTLLQYTENSRAQKDVSAADEIVNAIQLSLSDEDIYDEMLLYSCDNNYLTYTDSSGNYGQQIYDAEFWAPDGAGKATTITFNPSLNSEGQTVYKLSDALINDMTYSNGSIAENRIMQGQKIENNQCYLSNTEKELIYNRLKSVMGDAVLIESTTYFNSSFTVFIKWSQKDGVTTPEVYGCFNGTNLTNYSTSSVGSGTSEYETDEKTGEQIHVSTTNGGTTTSIYGATSLQGSGSLSYSTSISEDGKYDFNHYTTLEAAVNDINNNEIGKNAVDKDDPDVVASVHKYGNNITIQMLSDYTIRETIIIRKNLDLVLNGKTISNGPSSNFVFEVNDCNLTIDGKVEGSTLVNNMLNQDDFTYFGLIKTSNAKLFINEGTYLTQSQLECDAINIYANTSDLYFVNANFINISPNADISVNIQQTHGQFQANGTSFYLDATNSPDCGLDHVNLALLSTQDSTISNCEIVVDGKYAATCIFVPNRFSKNSDIIIEHCNLTANINQPDTYSNSCAGIIYSTLANITIKNSEINAHVEINAREGVL